jgi:hypothetical protein
VRCVIWYIDVSEEPGDENEAMEAVEARKVVRRLGTLIFCTVGLQMAMSLPALRAGRVLASRKSLDIHFCYRLS